MDSSRAHRHLFSLVASAMLTSGFFATAPNPAVLTAGAAPQPAALLGLIDGVRAPEAVAAPEKVSLRVKISTKASAPITHEQFLKLLGLINGSGGINATIPPDITAALGLTASDMPLRGISVDNDDDPQHIVTEEMYILPRGAGYAIFHVDGRANETRDKAYWAMKLDLDLKPLAGWDRAIGAHPSPIPNEKVQSLYASIMAVWAHIADVLG